MDGESNGGGWAREPGGGRHTHPGYATTQWVVDFMQREEEQFHAARAESILQLQRSFDDFRDYVQGEFADVKSSIRRHEDYHRTEEREQREVGREEITGATEAGSARRAFWLGVAMLITGLASLVASHVRFH